MSAEKVAPVVEPKGKKGKKGKGKKSKLPVFVVLSVVLLGGGFFGMKASKGKNVEKKPAIELGDHTTIVNLGSFLVNTRDGNMYLKANILVHLAKEKTLFEAGGHGKGPGIEVTAPFVDAIREVLAQQTGDDLKSPDGERNIKMKIAAAVNATFHRLDHKKDEKGEKKEEHPPASGGGDPTWDSQTGPVLIVYLTDYVWEFVS